MLGLFKQDEGSASPVEHLNLRYEVLTALTSVLTLFFIVTTINISGGESPAGQSAGEDPHFFASQANSARNIDGHRKITASGACRRQSCLKSAASASPIAN
jgi:hypothetical protein